MLFEISEKTSEQIQNVFLGEQKLCNSEECQEQQTQHKNKTKKRKMIITKTKHLTSRKTSPK